MAVSTLATFPADSLMSRSRVARGAVIAWAAAGCVMLSAPSARALSEDECRAHREAFVESLIHNRERSLRDLAHGAAGDTSVEARERLEYQQAQVYDHEERMRAVGDQIWRDCMAHLRAVASVPGTQPGQ